MDNLEPLARHALKYGGVGRVEGQRAGRARRRAGERGERGKCQGGGGVDGAITSAGGDLLAEKREALPALEGSDWRRCATGDAVVTNGGPFGSLRCDAVIHAVGPNYHSLPDGEGDELPAGRPLLRSRLRELDGAAKEEQCKTVAFSLLSAGIEQEKRSLDTPRHKRRPPWPTGRTTRPWPSRPQSRGKAAAAGLRGARADDPYSWSSASSRRRRHDGRAGSRVRAAAASTEPSPASTRWRDGFAGFACNSQKLLHNGP